MPEATPRPAAIDFYFDPGCPWTWATSRWLVSACRALDVAIGWQSLSLSVLRGDAEVPAQYRAAVEASVSAHRVMAALRADGRNELVGDVYTEWGRRTFHDGTEPSAALVKEVAAATGASQWAPAADDASWDGPVKESTDEAFELAGPDIGSPVLAFDQPRVGIFGPIVSPPPSGEAAVALFDLVVALARTPGLYELKRGRRQGPQPGPRP